MQPKQERKRRQECATEPIHVHTLSSPLFRPSDTPLPCSNCVLAYELECEAVFLSAISEWDSLPPIAGCSVWVSGTVSSTRPPPVPSPSTPQNMCCHGAFEPVMGDLSRSLYTPVFAYCPTYRAVCC
eukprot:RCo052047